jgi:hypothetical protein
MGLFDRMFGDAPRQPAATPSSDDEQAIARYRYLLKTAPPEAIEQAHAEAFARLTPEQRRKVLEELRAATPAAERATEPVLSDPQALARYATRAEIRRPGTLERTFGAMPGGVGFGGMIAGSLLGSMAGTVLGTAIAQQFLGQHGAADFGGLDHPHAVDGLLDGGSIVDAVDDDGGADVDMGDTFDV